MKKSIVILVITCGVIAAAIVYLNKPKTAPPPPAPVTETAPAAQPEPQPQEVVSIPKPPPAPATATEPQTITAAPVATNTVANEETNSIRKTVDALLAARGQKHAMFEQLRQNGQLDAVISELQRRATENPTDAAIPTTLGEALLNKVRAMHDAGVTDHTDLGILALQADQQFNAALKIDPKSWEAQFMKGSTIYYWPPDAERDADAAQRLASLIDQQDTMGNQPQFVQTYIALVKQYQKMGKQEEAAATLKLALQKFPGDPALQQMAAGQ